MFGGQETTLSTMSGERTEWEISEASGHTWFLTTRSLREKRGREERKPRAQSWRTLVFKERVEKEEVGQEIKKKWSGRKRRAGEWSPRGREVSVKKQRSTWSDVAGPLKRGPPRHG